MSRGQNKNNSVLFQLSEIKNGLFAKVRFVFKSKICQNSIIMENELLIENIKKLKAERNAIILSHFYIRREVQEVADFIGDSLSLCKAAVNSKADVIVFAGVHFMAESASIISPEKLVLLPVPDAGCPMADMVTAESLRDAKEKHPDAAVVCYVNSLAAVKAESDICCTSANAINCGKFN